MSIERIVQVVISRQTRGVTQAGFGIPLILGPNAGFSGVRTYRTLAAVSADFATSTDEYKAAQKIFSQTPKPERIKVKKTSTPVAQVMNVVVATVTDNGVYTVTINGVPFSFTADADATAAEIQAGLISAINAGAEPVTAAAGAGTSVNLTSDAAGQAFTATVGDNKLTISTATANVGIQSDILAAMQQDKDWYALHLSVVDDVSIKEAAAAIEGLRRIFGFRTNASGVKSAATNDIVSFLKNKGYNRTFGFFSGTPADYADAALMGRVLPLEPGSETWAFKELSGVTVDGLTDSEVEFLEDKNANFYIEVAGLKVTQGGKMVGGEYIDTMRGIDKLQARIEERVFQLLAKVDKVPFTDAGIAQVQAEVIGALKGAQTDGLVLSFTTSVPKASEVEFADKAARVLPDVRFEAILQGAVHFVKVEGVVTL